jgi:hypothetical protein
VFVIVFVSVVAFPAVKMAYLSYISLPAAVDARSVSRRAHRLASDLVVANDSAANERASLSVTLPVSVSVSESLPIPSPGLDGISPPV